MKKTLIAMAALAATGAFAQNVTVYGRLDAGYAMTTTTAGGVDTKNSGVQSHNSVSSMWGLKGSEDLGGGMNAFFILEQDIYPANGNVGVTGAAGGVGVSSSTVSTSTSKVATEVGFNRTALIGASGGFGTVAFGRDYVPTFKVIAATDVNSLSRISTIQLANPSGNSSQPNLVFYSTPDISGFKLNVAYGNQDKTVSTQAETSLKITNVSATYANGPLYIGVGTGTNEDISNGAGNGSFTFGTSASPVTGIQKTTGTVLAAAYDFGRAKLTGNMITSKSTLATSEFETTENNIGVSVPMGKVTLVGQYGMNKLKVQGAAEDYTGTDWVLGADYALSARTAVFLKTGTYGKLSGNGADLKTVSTAFGIKTTF
jgi:predicted porin